MSKNNPPAANEPSIDATILLQKSAELLIATYIPPIPAGTPVRKKHDGHPPNQPLERDENGEITRITYDKDSFGWSKDEREPAFVKYHKKQAKRLGRTLVSETVEKIKEPKPKAGAARAKRSKK